MLTPHNNLQVSLRAKSKEIPESIGNLIDSSTTWTALSPDAVTVAEDEERRQLGVLSPIVRTAAWQLLKTLTSTWPDGLDLCLPIAGPRALSAAWKEKDAGVVPSLRESLVSLLRARPGVWAMSSDKQSPDEDGDDDDEEEGESEEEEGEEEGSGEEDGGDAMEEASEEKGEGALGTPTRSIFYHGFLDYLSSALQGVSTSYPIVIILLSTLPSDLFRPTSAFANELLAAFYRPVDERTLEGREALRAFVPAFCECLVWISARIARRGQSRDADVAEAENMVKENLVVFWKDFVGTPAGETITAEDAALRASRIRLLGNDLVVREVSGLLRRLANVDAKLAAQVLDLSRRTLSASILTGADPGDNDEDVVDRMVAILGAASLSTDSTAAENLRRATTDLARDVSGTTANLLVTKDEHDDAQEQRRSLLVISRLLATFPSAHKDETIRQALGLVVDQLLSRSAKLGLLAPSRVAELLVSYLSLVDGAEERKQVLENILKILVIPGGTVDVQLLSELDRALQNAMRSSLAQDEEGGLMLPPLQTSELDKKVKLLLTDTLAGDDNVDVTTQAVLTRLLDNAGPFIQEETSREMLQTTVSRLDQDCRHLWLLAAWIRASPAQRGSQCIKEERLQPAASAAFSVAYLGTSKGKEIDQGVARGMWKEIHAAAPQEARSLVTKSLQASVLDVGIDLQQVIDGCRAAFEGAQLQKILPEQEALNELLLASSSNPSCSLVIIDPLVPFHASATRREAAKYDHQGFSAMARCGVTMLTAFEEDGLLARNSAASLPYLLAFTIAAEDSLLQPGSALSHFSTEADQGLLQQWVRAAVEVATSILSAGAGQVDEQWHAQAIESLQKDGGSGNDALLTALSFAWRMVSNETTSSMGVRIFSRLLSGILAFSGAGESEAKMWLRLAQISQESRPRLSEAILLNVKDAVEESREYDRIRNEVAARMAGTSPDKASSLGLRDLRLLVAAAPDVDSTTMLIPQQRAIMLLKTFQKWVASDKADEFEDEMHARMAQVFMHVLPIVQEMAGSHLDLCFDLVETGLSGRNIYDVNQLPLIHSFLVLLDMLRTLAARSETLRAVWKQRRSTVYEAVRDLFLSLAQVEGRDADKAAIISTPQEVTFTLLSDFVRFMPPKTFRSDGQDIEQLCTIMERGPSTDLQVTAYRLLSYNIRERVKELVIEAAVGTKKQEEAEAQGEEETFIPAPPPVKVDFTGRLSTMVSWPPQYNSSFTFLVSWLALLDHFEEASLQLKATFAGLLQDSEAITRSLLPAMLDLTMSTAIEASDPPFDPSKWAVDEIFLDEIDPTSANAIRLFATHIYFRCLVHVPNLVRESWYSLRDRQQSLFLRNLTSRHCSPLLSLRELAHLRDPSTLKRIEDESMSVRVLAHEVVATYTVDEYPLEIAISIPNDYPLRSVEVKDLKRVGVSESTWRAWILAVRQLIAGKNGLVFDALLLFKSNVEAKFSGFDEDSTCAVCYSIVSPTDRTLPTKPCKTCKKKFHSSCLYKWVSTSGSSTCPLCRSIL